MWRGGWPGFVAWFRCLSYDASPDAGSRRDLRLDLLRGFCIFAMVVDHIGGDSWLYAITGGNRFYVSAAEGFIFISGFVMGQVYLGRILRIGLLDAMIEALKRARTLYLATVALTLLFSALYTYTDITLWTGRDFGLGIETFDEIVVGALTVHYTYHGTDILAMYTLLIVVAPVTLLLLARGQWAWVLAASWGWWYAFQVYPEEAALPWYIRHGENFPIGAWQVLFLTGMVLGYHRAHVAAWLGRWPRVRIVLVALCVSVALALLSIFWATDGVEGEPVPLFPFFDVDPAVLSDSFFKVPLRPWRLVAFTSVAMTLFAAATYLWVPLRRVLGWLLLPLGQHALYGYIVHFFLILLVYNLVPLIESYIPEGPAVLLTSVIQVGVILLLWLLIRRKILFSIVPS